MSVKAARTRVVAMLTVVLVTTLGTAAPACSVVPERAAPAPAGPTSDRMVLIAGEEDTSPVMHMVVLNLPGSPPKFIIRTVQGRMDDVARQGGLAIGAHPDDFFSGVSEDRLKALKGYLGIELASNKPATKWDAVLTDRASGDEQLLWGFMDDDAHKPEEHGRRFIMVRAPALSKSAVTSALSEGSFYWSDGPLFKDIYLSGQTISVELAQDASITFVGLGGRALETVTGRSARFSISGDEGYVRVEIATAGKKRAGTQPFRIVSVSKIENPYARSGQWYKGNLHAHTTLSDGALTPEQAVRWYEDNGYGFLAVTDHVPWNVPAD